MARNSPRKSPPCPMICGLVFRQLSNRVGYNSRPMCSVFAIERWPPLSRRQPTRDSRCRDLSGKQPSRRARNLLGNRSRVPSDTPLPLSIRACAPCSTARACVRQPGGLDALLPTGTLISGKSPRLCAAAQKSWPPAPPHRRRLCGFCRANSRMRSRISNEAIEMPIWSSAYFMRWPDW
jgi:hypothetical protein